MKRQILLLQTAIIVALVGFGCASTHESVESSTAAPAAAEESKPAAMPETKPAPAAAAPAQVQPVSTAPAQPETAATSSIHLKVVKADSEETAGEDGKAANAVDGNTNTFWHTQWQDATPEPPHEIVIELSPASNIKGFTYLPRQDESENGTIKDYELYVSKDGANFEPVAKGTFQNNKDKKSVTFAPASCRFIKLKALSEANDGAWTSAAEIGVIPAD